jgi:transposase
MPGPVAAPGPHLKYITDTLTDQLWKRLEPLTPTPARRYRFPGRRRVDNRAALEGILFVVRTGICWNDLPTTAFGVSGATCWRRLKECHQAGVWQRLHESLLAELRSAGLLDLAHTVVDSSHLGALNGGTSPVPARSTGAGWAASTT